MKRIFNLDKRLIYFIVPMVLLICIEFAFGILGATYGLKTVTFESLASPNAWAQAVVGIWLGSGVVVDIGIATDRIQEVHLIIFNLFKKNLILDLGLNTCVLTSVAAVLDLITFYKQDVAGEALFICYMALCGPSLNRRAAFRSEVQGATPGAVSTGLVIQHDSMSPSHTFESDYNSNSQLSPQTTILPTPVTPTPGSRGHWDVEMRAVSPHGHEHDHEEDYSDKHNLSPVNHRKSFA
ncbi:hypothetical protein Clacol_009988 [Clathrus columnatus]|uniref:Integral membrane protein n=1 Tax=Clathrus columnatus TaxID=1419009 RepID=A0AAV5ASK7_9AGAM|nr:hypothetical protein Clacol_009988 [Clathrus columnatus]